MFPNFCHNCGREDGFLCGRCFHSVTFQPHVRDLNGLEAMCALYYEPESLLGELVHFYKFEHGQALKALFTSWMQEVLRLFLGGRRSIALIPAPSSPRHFHDRGFDPATELARCLGSTMEVPIFEILKRHDDSDVFQHALSRDERKSHAEGLFDVIGTIPKGYELVLVDDIVTTGSTLLSAQTALAEAGISVKRAITLADRALSHDHRH